MNLNFTARIDNKNADLWNLSKYLGLPDDYDPEDETISNIEIGYTLDIDTGSRNINRTLHYEKPVWNDGIERIALKINSIDFDVHWSFETEFVTMFANELIQHGGCECGDRMEGDFHITVTEAEMRKKDKYSGKETNPGGWYIDDGDAEFNNDGAFFINNISVDLTDKSITLSSSY